MCQAAVTQSEAAYKQQMIGVGLYHQERQRVRVQCPECGEEMVLGLLLVHLKTQHRKATLGRCHWVISAPGGEPHTYKMGLPTAGVPRNCPVKGCWGQAAKYTAMQVHLLHQHVRYTVIILEEGNLPHPR